VAKQIANHGLTPEAISFTDEGLRLVIRGYTREAGVRNLEREIASLCRKIARRRAEGRDAAVTIGREVVIELLGAPRFLDEEMEERTKNPGVAIGLAWTPVGGEVLFIEASRMAGTGSLTLTGQLGDVMKESARIALTYVQSHAADLGIDEHALDLIAIAQAGRQQSRVNCRAPRAQTNDIHDQDPNRDNPQENTRTNQRISSSYPLHCKPIVTEAV
jgi:ATP-dependent Lon protease